jgi:type VI secretion system secreted protein VgrG
MSALPYELSVDGFPPDHFRVYAFTGQEKMSGLYAFDVEVTAPGGGEDEIERTALGQRAILTWNVGNTPRAFYAVVASVRIIGLREGGAATRYEVRLVPRLFLLKRKRRTRIFQRQRVPDIVTSVLLEAGIATRWQLSHAYPEREYCTQYEERVPASTGGPSAK